MVKKMKVLGLILELNPYHNGHEYFINKAIEAVNPDYTVAIITSSFSMRGDIFVSNKFERTNELLKKGIDVVIELPTAYTLNNADIFGYTTVEILKKFKMTDLAFGVETNDLESLSSLVKIMNSDEYNLLLKSFLDKGNSYSTSSYKSILSLTNDEKLSFASTLPNNTLAIQYLKHASNINIHPITRINNDYYDKELNSSSIQSATALRRALLDNLDISNYVPTNLNYINQEEAYKNLYMILKYQLSKNKDFSIYLNCKEGIENRIINCINNSSSFDEFVDNVKTKRYPPNRIKRTILSIILEITDNYINEPLRLRVLGMSTNGEKLIKSLNKEVKKNIVTTLKNNTDEVFKIELNATKLYDIITNQNTLINEFKVPYKEDKNDSK